MEGRPRVADDPGIGTEGEGRRGAALPIARSATLDLSALAGRGPGHGRGGCESGGKRGDVGVSGFLSAQQPTCAYVLDDGKGVVDDGRVSPAPVCSRERRRSGLWLVLRGQDDAG